MSVSLIVVSHSVKLAEGVVELAGQMAPDVKILPAGGMDDGGLGTSLTKISAAIVAADVGDGVLILADLGSAVMTAESALELAGEPEHVRLADAPLVEGLVAAAVAAQSGVGLAEVQAAAEGAAAAMRGAAGNGAAPFSSAPFNSSAASSDQVVPTANGRVFQAEAVLVNPMGLHARPAATLAAALGAMNVEIEINGVDGQSVMMLMTLGATEGTLLRIEASGPDAQRAVELVTSEVARGFGEI